MGTNDKTQAGLFSKPPVGPQVPLVLAGHIGVCVYEDLHVTWHVARLDLASKRMLFPAMGAFMGSPRTLTSLSETLNSASLQYIDFINSMYD
jgi:hypothetical protein